MSPGRLGENPGFAWRSAFKAARLVRDVGSMGAWSSAAPTALVNFGGLADVAFDHPGGDLLVVVNYSFFLTVASSSLFAAIKVGSLVSPEMRHFANELSSHKFRTQLARFAGLARGSYAVNVQVRTVAAGGTFNTDLNDYLQVLALPLGG